MEWPDAFIYCYELFFHNIAALENNHIGLTVEKSAFGKYNVDNAINVNF